MTDKERILLKLILQFKFTYALKQWGEEHFINTWGKSDVHFAKWLPVKTGMLVFCESSGIHGYTIGYVETIITDSEMVIREIGSNKTCHIANESFCPIVGMNETDLLEQDEYKIYMKVLKAFQRGQEFNYRFGGIKFPSNRNIEIFIQERFEGLPDKTKPFSFIMQWDNKTTIKKILIAMITNGYGTKKFEPLESEVKDENKKTYKITQRF